MDYIHTNKYIQYSLPLVPNSIKLICLLIVICLVLLSGAFTPSRPANSEKVLGITTTVTTPQQADESLKDKKPLSSKQHYAMIFEEEIIAKEYVVPTSTPTPTKMPVQAGDTQGNDKEGWGVPTQIGPDTWTMKVKHDEAMATASEIFAALNVYRQKKGREALSLDDRLLEYAQRRADFFASRDDIDAHVGFRDFLQNQDGFIQLGFGKLGENSSWGYQLESVHLIEWVYGGDKPHDDNQLNPEWTHVGIGVNDTSTDLVFGGKKR